MIRVYAGSGSNRNGYPLLMEELCRHLDQEVACIDEHEMRGSSAWQHMTSTLIFAGQSVGQFKKALGEDVLDNIKRGVAGGSFDYIGICAGAAFASAKIKYRMKPFLPSQPALIEAEGLSMFNGLASGPSKSVSSLPYSGLSENLHLIELKSLNTQKTYNSFHWGGPSLIPMDRNNGQILSCLKADGTPMSWKLQYGQGSVTICSHHPEINAGNIGRWAESRFLSDTEALRLETLTRRLDGTAFMNFLLDSGLKSRPIERKQSPVSALHVG